MSCMVFGLVDLWRRVYVTLSLVWEGPSSCV